MTIDDAKKILKQSHGSRTEVFMMRDSELSTEGLKEALRLGYLVPDYETGGLQLTLNASQTAALESIAGAPAEVKPVAIDNLIRPASGHEYFR